MILKQIHEKKEVLWLTGDFNDHIQKILMTSSEKLATTQMVTMSLANVSDHIAISFDVIGALRNYRCKLQLVSCDLNNSIFNMIHILPSYSTMNNKVTNNAEKSVSICSVPKHN